jgi:hypothetical protein
VTPSQARESAWQTSDAGRTLDQQIVKIRIAAIEVDALREKGCFEAGAPIGQFRQVAGAAREAILKTSVVVGGKPPSSLY